MDAADAVLEVNRLAMTYGTRRTSQNRPALVDVDLTIDSGQSLALLGPNGSGKSTLIKIIAGVLHPSAGSVRVDGRESPAQRRPRISVVLQSNGLDPHLTVEENLRCQARLYGFTRTSAQQRIDEELIAAQIDDRRSQLVKTLSGGLARRADLARAMLHRPRLLILDEPTTGLDPAARQSFLDLIDQRRQASNMSVLISTHLTDEADRADRVVFMHEGRIVAQGASAQLRADFGHMLLTLHASAVPAPLNARDWRKAPGGWTLQIPDARSQLDVVDQLAQQGCAYTVAPPTLADVFIDLTGAALQVPETAKPIRRSRRRRRAGHAEGVR